MLLKGTYWLHSKPILEVSQYDLLTNTELRVVFPKWPSRMASKPAHHKQRVARPSPIFQIGAYVLLLIVILSSFNLW